MLKTKMVENFTILQITENIRRSKLKWQRVRKQANIKCGGEVNVFQDKIFTEKSTERKKIIYGGI